MTVSNLTITLASEPLNTKKKSVLCNYSHRLATIIDKQALLFETENQVNQERDSELVACDVVSTRRYILSHNGLLRKNLLVRVGADYFQMYDTW